MIGVGYTRRFLYHGRLVATSGGQWRGKEIFGYKAGQSGSACSSESACGLCGSNPRYCFGVVVPSGTGGLGIWRSRDQYRDILVKIPKPPNPLAMDRVYWRLSDVMAYSYGRRAKVYNKGHQSDDSVVLDTDHREGKHSEALEFEETLNPYLKYRNLVGGMKRRTPFAAPDERPVLAETYEDKYDEFDEENRLDGIHCYDCLWSIRVYEVCMCECMCCELEDDCRGCLHHRERPIYMYDEQGVADPRRLPRGDGFDEARQAHHNHIMHAQNGNVFSENIPLDNVEEEKLAMLGFMRHGINKKFWRQAVSRGTDCPCCGNENLRCYCQVMDFDKYLRDYNRDMRRVMTLYNIQSELQYDDDGVEEEVVAVEIVVENVRDVVLPLPEVVVLAEQQDQLLENKNPEEEKVVVEEKEREVKEAEQPVCPICMDETNRVDFETPCGHLYHSTCLATWMGMRRNCPACRAPLEADIIDGVAGDGDYRFPWNEYGWQNEAVGNNAERKFEVDDIDENRMAELFPDPVIWAAAPDVQPPFQPFIEHTTWSYSVPEGDFEHALPMIGRQVYDNYTGLTFNLWAWENCRNTRAYDVVVNYENETAMVDGIFKFGGVAQFVFQVIPFLRVNSQVGQHSDCSTLVRVVDMDLTIPAYRHQSDINNFNLVNPEELLFEITCDQARMVLLSGGVIDHMGALSRIKANYCKHVKDTVGLDKKIERIIMSKRFIDYRNSIAVEAKVHRIARLEAAVNVLLSERSETYGWLNFMFILRTIIRPWTWFPAVLFGREYKLETMLATLGEDKARFRAIPLCSKKYYSKFSKVRDGWRVEDEELFEGSTFDIANNTPFVGAPEFEYKYDFTGKPQEVESYGVMIDAAQAYPESSSDSVINAVVKRILFPRNFQLDAIEDYRQYTRGLIQQLPRFDFLEKDWDEYRLGKYSAKLAARMYKEWMDHVFSELMELTGFCKAEGYLGKTSETAKDRLIISYPNWFIVEYGPFFAAFGSCMAVQFNWLSNCFYATKTSPEKLGAFVESMEGMHIYESDVSNWDGSMQWWHAEAFVNYIEHASPYLPENWFWLKKRLVGYTMRTKDKNVYLKVAHALASGGLWTSQFNTFINFTKVMWISRTDFYSNTKIMALGDDNVFALEQALDVAEATRLYECHGMKIEIIERLRGCDVTFCSGLFYPVNGHLVWGNMPFRTLMKLGINHNYHREEVQKRLLYGTALSLLPSARHVPILGDLLEEIVKTAESRKLKPLKDNSHMNPYRPQGGSICYPATDTIAWFAERYGMELWMIYHLMREIRIDINDFPIMLEAQWVNDGVEKDIGMFEHMESFRGVSLKDQVCVLGPIEEEKEKLMISKRTGKHPLVVAYEYGLDEVKNGAPFSNITNHMYFTMLYLIDPDRGIAAHQRHNLYAWDNNQAALCNSRKKKKKGKKVVVAVSAVRPGRKRKRRRAKVGSGGINAMMRGVVNPFDARSYGAKIPDDFLLETGSGALKSEYIVNGDSTTASLCAVALMLPWAKYAMYRPLNTNVTDAGNVTWAGGTSYTVGSFTGFQNIVGLYRVVNWGVRITVDTSMTTTDGHIWITHYPIDASTDIYGYGQLWTTEAQMASSPYSIKYSLAELTEKPVIVPGRRSDAMGYNFVTENYMITASSGVVNSPGWCSISILAIGKSVVPALVVEHIMHIEYVPDLNGTNTFGLANSAPYPPNIQMLERSQTLQIAVPSAYPMSDDLELEGDSYLEKLMRAANSMGRFVSNNQVARTTLRMALSSLSGVARTRGSAYLNRRALMAP